MPLDYHRQLSIYHYAVALFLAIFSMTKTLMGLVILGGSCVILVG